MVVASTAAAVVAAAAVVVGIQARYFSAGDSARTSGSGGESADVGGILAINSSAFCPVIGGPDRCPDILGYEHTLAPQLAQGKPDRPEQQ